MKTIITYSIWVFFVGLVVVNIFIFVASIRMGAEMNVSEQKIETLRRQNMEMEDTVVSLNSFQYASSLAATLNFTRRAQPVYLDTVSYALNR